MRARVPVFGLLWLTLALAFSAVARPVTYDIVSVRAPRAGDNTYVRFPGVFCPTAMPSGSDLLLLRSASYGSFNPGACPLPGGKLMFVSKNYTTPNL